MNAYIDQLDLSPSPPPVSRGAAPQLSLFEMKSVLLSTWFLGMTIAAGIICLLMLLASIAGQSRVESAPIDPVMQQIEVAQANLQQVSFETSEQRRRDDFNPARPENYGDMQALIQQAAIEIRAEVDRQFSDPNHPNYQKNKVEIYQSLRADAMLLTEVALSGQATINYENPADGKKRSIKMRGTELAAYAVFRLEAVNTAMNSPISIPVDLVDVLGNIAQQEYRAKDAKADEQEALGQTEVAARLRATTVFGDEVDEIDPRMNPMNLP